MALTIAELNARLTADATQFNSQMRSAEGSVRRFEGETSKATGQVDKHMGAMRNSARNLAVGIKAFIAVSAVRSIGQFVMSIGEAAQSQEAWLATNEIVFGEAGEIIDDFALNAADALGLTVTQAAKGAQSIGMLFNQAGVAEEESAHLSQAVVQLATDLAAFNEISVDEALQRIESGLIGNLESWQALGIPISDVDVQQQALAMNLADTSAELTQQDKLLARTALLFGEAGPMIGSFARGEDTLQVQTMQLTQEFEDLKAELGQAVLPVLKSGVELLRGFVGELESVFEASKRAIGVLGDLADGFDDLTISVPGASNALDFLGDAWNWASRNAALATGDAEGYIDTLDDTGPAAEDAADSVTSAADLIEAAQASIRAEAEDANAEMEKQKDLAADVKDASFSLRDAQFSLADAQEEYNELLATGGVDMRALEQATDDLARAQEDLADANETVTDAQENLNEAIERATERHLQDLERATEDVKDAQDDLRDSTVELADEQGKLAKMKAQKESREQAIKNAKAQLESADTITERVIAEEKLEAALGMEIVTGAEVEAQELAVGDARKDVQRDTDDLNTATRDLNTVERQNVMETDLVKDAQERLQGANVAAKEATDGLAAAQRGLNSAQQPAPGFADDLARAELDLEKAEWAVEKATRAHVTAVDDLNTSLSQVPELTEAEILVKWHESFPVSSPSGLGAGGASFGIMMPAAHDGGVVPGPRGADVPIMAQAGETITPLGGGGGVGNTVNVTINAQVVEQDAAQWIVDQLRDGRLYGVEDE